jgi:hypothetical protein
MIFNPFPTISSEMLKELEARFPDKCPPQNSSIEEIYRKQGQVSVVAFLRAQFTQQNLNILDN